jgi:hypothetical protein
MKMYCQGCDWSYESSVTAPNVQNCPRCYGSWFSSQPRIQCPTCGTKFAMPVPTSPDNISFAAGGKE